MYDRPNCFDPYLRYAIASDFKNFASFDEKTFRVFLLVEFRSLDRANAFKKAVADPKYAVEFSPVDRDSLYTTMRAHKSVVTDAFRDTSKDARPDGNYLFDAWNDNVSRVELSLPLVPTDQRAFARKIVERSRANPPEHLIGLLDDGCPFAAAQFLTTLGGTDTRVLGIWDQNQTLGPWYGSMSRQPIPAGTNAQFGRFLPDFNYGIEFLHDSTAGTPTVVGLSDWMASHRTGAGSVDEDSCYADAEFTTLRRQVSHGAHVMDVLAGRIPTSSRIVGRNPPSWEANADPASTTGVVFVQFADQCIRDATGVWLKAYVKDGIDYIMTFTKPYVTKTVVINISYGPTTGPHDGTAELEDTLRDLVSEYDGSSGKPKLHIALAAGNAYLTEGHIAYVRSEATMPDSVAWTWRLPPDNTVLCFAEVWMQTHDAAHVTVTLTSPGGIVFSSTSGPVSPGPGVPIPPYTGVFAPVAWGSSTVWLLAVEPTVATAGTVAEHGDWTVKVEYVDTHAKVHAYVARSDPNMGMHTGAKRSYFVDAAWEADHGASAGCTYANGVFEKHGSLIHRRGTLNGIATEKVRRIHVAGSYILSNGRKAPYSSAGPARGGPRLGPDYVLPGDESCALQGIRAGGNRSGSVFRLEGTSTAAPQLARLFVDTTPLSPSNIPGTPGEIAERGGGNLPPP
ncbi:hypothetical protein [Bradyrhizobium sp. CCBAU 51753]|uniref:hypothetical protein n=1 Tax=Bradyrhizobium sp. CCBAU 51753 TaxID=1325100 RepID=UPI00188A5876|nr:hypothetical protein [Bradyrhizobium sp. CCBAU 51753]